MQGRTDVTTSLPRASSEGNLIREKVVFDWKKSQRLAEIDKRLRQSGMPWQEAELAAPHIAEALKSLGSQPKPRRRSDPRLTTLWPSSPVGTSAVSPADKEVEEVLREMVKVVTALRFETKRRGVPSANSGYQRRLLELLKRAESVLGFCAEGSDGKPGVPAELCCNDQIRNRTMLLGEAASYSAVGTLRLLEEDNFEVLVQRSEKLGYQQPTHENRMKKYCHTVALQELIAEHADETWPVIHPDVLNLATAFLKHKQLVGIEAENQVYQNLNINTFICRLLTMRPLCYDLETGKCILRDGSHDADVANFATIGTDSERSPLVLAKYQSHAEIELAGLVGMSALTSFINTGKLSNRGALGETDSFEAVGVCIGLAGPQLTKEGLFDWQHMLITETQNTPQNGYGEHSTSSDPMLEHWAELYRVDHFPSYEEAFQDLQDGGQRFLRYGNALLDTEVYRTRCEIMAETFLAEANSRAGSSDTCAFCHVISLGSWTPEVIVMMQSIQLDAYATRLQEMNLPHVGEVHFSRFTPDACGDVSSAQEIRGAGGNQIRLVFDRRNFADKLPDPLPGQRPWLLVVQYELSSNSYVGNEYWTGRLDASGAAALASCSLLPELQNPEVNREAFHAGKVHVISFDGGKIKSSDGRLPGWRAEEKRALLGRLPAALRAARLPESDQLVKEALVYLALDEFQAVWKIPGTQSGTKSLSSSQAVVEGRSSIVGALEQKNLGEALQAAGYVPLAQSSHTVNASCLLSKRVVEQAELLLRTWQASYSNMRQDARLADLVQRCLKFNEKDRQAGERLNAMLIDMKLARFGGKQVQEAKKTLERWTSQRRIHATKDLEIAMEHRDQGWLEILIPEASAAGISEEALEAPNALLTRLKYEEMINDMLKGGMESPGIENLEAAISQAHRYYFVEDESLMLQIAVLESKMRFWTREFEQRIVSRELVDIEKEVGIADELLKRAEDLLSDERMAEMTEAAPRTLEMDFDDLSRTMPQIRDMAAVASAEGNLRRVLGAVERHAEELPAVIKEGELQLKKGLDPKLVKEAKHHQENYVRVVKHIKAVVEADDDVPSPALEELRDLVKKARLAGAPMELIHKGLAMIDSQDLKYRLGVQDELDFLVALEEADDIGVISVEDRFHRLHDAAEKAEQIKAFEVPQELFDRVEETAFAIAAERALMTEINEAKALIGDSFFPPKPAASEVIANCATKLKHAAAGAEENALPEVKKFLPTAEKLQGQLRAKEIQRQHAEAILLEATLSTKPKARSLAGIRGAIRVARDGGVEESRINELYERCTYLRKKSVKGQVDHLMHVSKPPIVAAALWHLSDSLGVELTADELRQLETQMEKEDSVIIHRASFYNDRDDERGYQHGSSFGTAFWRSSPQFAVHLKDPRPPSGGGGSVGVQVTAIVVEGRGAYAEDNDEERSHTGSYRGSPKSSRSNDSPKSGNEHRKKRLPATIELHAVRNQNNLVGALKKCGLSNTLLPGYQVLKASTDKDDLAMCKFHLVDDQPVFLVPSVALAETGPFTLLVSAAAKIEVKELTEVEKSPWAQTQSFELDWCGEIPHEKTMGGPCRPKKAPVLSWYRNPQFRISKSKPAAEAQQERKSVFVEVKEAASVPEEASGAKPVISAARRTLQKAAKKMSLVRMVAGEGWGVGAVIFAILQPVVQVDDDELERPRAGLHILRNRGGRENDMRIAENPRYHSVLTNSSPGKGSEYLDALEIAAIYNLPDKAPLFVVPSLSTPESEGKFTLKIYCTKKDINIERV